jgi:hypothetical protein
MGRSANRSAAHVSAQSADCRCLRSRGLALSWAKPPPAQLALRPPHQHATRHTGDVRYRSYVNRRVIKRHLAAPEETLLHKLRTFRTMQPQRVPSLGLTGARKRAAYVECRLENAT